MDGCDFFEFLRVGQCAIRVAAYINLVSASDVASREYPAVSQMDVSVGKKA